VQKSPWTFYVYVTFPCYFWNQVILHASQHVNVWFNQTERSFVSYGKALIQGSLAIGILQSMVVRIHRLHYLLLPDWHLGRLYSPMVMESRLCADGCNVASLVVAKPYPF